MCLLIVRVQTSSPWQHTSIHPGLVSLLFIPSLYSFLKIFHLLASFLFCCTLHIKLYALRNILPAIYCCLHTCCVYVVLSELGYVWTPTFIATIASYRHFLFILKRLPEAILQTCNVDVVLLVMHIPAFIVTSAALVTMKACIYMQYITGLYQYLWVSLCNIP